MKRIAAVVAFGIGLYWASSANAACISEAQCDAGNCGQMETCADATKMSGAIDLTQVKPDNVPSMPLENDLLAESPVAAAVADATCREVEICGSTQLVCD